MLKMRFYLVLIQTCSNISFQLHFKVLVSRSHQSPTPTTLIGTSGCGFCPVTMSIRITQNSYIIDSLFGRSKYFPLADLISYICFASHVIL